MQVSGLARMVRTTSERFLQAWATFRVGSASESHWLQPMLVLTIHRRPILVCVGGLLIFCHARTY